MRPFCWNFCWTKRNEPFRWNVVALISCWLAISCRLLLPAVLFVVVVVVARWLHLHSSNKCTGNSPRSVWPRVGVSGCCFVKPAWHTVTNFPTPTAHTWTWPLPRGRIESKPLQPHHQRREIDNMWWCCCDCDDDCVSHNFMTRS